MNQLILTRRQILKAAGAAGGLVAASSFLGPAISLAGLDARDDQPLGPFGDWTPPVPIDEVASGATDYHPAISPDGRSLYFTSTRDAPSFPAEIMVIERAGPEGPWDAETLRPVQALNLVGFNTGVPNLTPDGHYIYFQSKRPGGAGASSFANLWVSQRDDPEDNDGWGTPTLVAGGINEAGFSNTAATYFRVPETGEVRMYVARYPGAGTIGAPGEKWVISVCNGDAAGNFDVDDNGIEDDDVVQALNTPWPPPANWPTGKLWPSRDTRTAIRRDGLEIFVTSNRVGGVWASTAPAENLWVATRADTSSENWQNMQPVPGLNSGFGDGGPALSWDARTLYFFSQRPAGGNRQIWMSTRRPLDD